jgi:hypothetical protein
VRVGVFELLCVVVVAGTLGAMARVRPWRELLSEYAWLAVAGWFGEQSCVAWYRFYEYAGAWHLRLGHVPVLVPIIWPLVILSARDVARALWPTAWTPGVVAALVAFDASLIEVVAVRAGLWSWAEPGHLSVPLAGIVGWAWFALGTTAARRPWAQALSGVLVTHALVVATWWGGLRWVLRGELGGRGFVLLALGSFALVLAVLRARRRGRTMPKDVALPRVGATVLIAALLVSARDTAALWAHAALVAVPYLLASVRLRRSATSPPAP